MRGRKSLIVVAVAVILMPFIENLLGLRQMMIATADAVVETLVMKDSSGHIEVTQSHLEDGDQITWQLNYKRDVAGEASKLKFAVDDQAQIAGVQIHGEGFTMVDGWLTESDFSTSSGVVSIVAPAGQNIGLSVDFNKVTAVTPLTATDDTETNGDGEGQDDEEGPISTIVENVLTNTGESGPYLLEAPEITASESESVESDVVDTSTEVAEEAPVTEEETVADEELVTDEEPVMTDETPVVTEEQPETDVAQSEVDSSTSDGGEETEPVETGESEDVDSQADASDKEISGPIKGDMGVYSLSLEGNDATLYQGTKKKSRSSEITIEKADKKTELISWDDRQYKITIDTSIKGEIRESGADVLMVMDVSGSMKEDSRLDRLKNQAQKFMMELAGGSYDEYGNPIKDQDGKIITRSTLSNMALVSYGSEASALTTPTASGGASFINISQNIDSLFTTVEKLSDGGATRADLGMKMAYQSVKDRTTDNPLFVIFLSDGVPTRSSEFHGTVATEAQSWSSLIQNRLATTNEWSFTNVTRVLQKYDKNTNKWKNHGNPVAYKPDNDLTKHIISYLNQNYQESTNGVNYTEDTRNKNERYLYSFDATIGAVTGYYGQSDRSLGTSYQPYKEIKVSKDTPAIVTTTPVQVYGIQQSKKWPDPADKAKKFMNGLATSSNHVYMADDDENLTKIFQGIANQIKDAGVIDTIDKHFELTKDQKALLDERDIPYEENEDGTTTIRWPSKYDAENQIVVKETLMIQAKESFVGGNAVPTNVPEKSGIYSEGQRIAGFEVSKDLETPFVNVKVLPMLKGVTTEEGIHQLGDEVLSYDDIKEGWEALVQPVAKGDLQEGQKPLVVYDDTLGKYPEVIVLEFKDYQEQPQKNETYHSFAVAGAEDYSNGNSKALEYADTVAVNIDEGPDVPGTSASNVQSVDVFHIVKMAGTPEVTVHQKDTVMTSWENRIYEITIQAAVTQEEESEETYEANVIDVLDSRFELTTTGKEQVERLGGEYLPGNNIGTTRIVFPVEINAEPTTFTFEIQAKADYIGGNAVPTNLPNNSGVEINGLGLKHFTIGKDTNLTTPYVNVKLLPLTVKNTEETSWLGDVTVDKDTLIDNWELPTNYYFGNRDDNVSKVVNPPVMTWPETISKYQPIALGDITYTETVFAKAGLVTDVARLTTEELENSVTPLDYADTTALGTQKVGKSDDNTVTAQVEHILTVETTELTLEKQLGGTSLPVTESFNYDADFNIVSPESFEELYQATTDFGPAVNQWALTLSNLGIGTYTITEEAPMGVETPEPWTLEITYITDAGVPSYTLSQGAEETPLTELHNELNDFVLNVKKIDQDGADLAGAQFTLTKLDDPEFTPVTLGTEEATADFAFAGLRPGVYQLEETFIPDNYLALEKTVTFEITAIGQVLMDDQDIGYEATENKNEIYLDITNIATGGVLPETGGPGMRHFMIASLLFMGMAVVAMIYYVGASKKGGI